ncbi:hypothetical protein FRC16_003453 [Serendipita sp. 398]|nr:hypothetical protein FRC16_003453 [Serendipita sp. 398]
MSEWESFFKNPSDQTRGLMVAAQTFGSFIMLPFAPLMSDGFGRRKTLCIGSAVICGGVLLQAMSTGIPHFIASRVLVGVGLCIATNAAPLLITELAYPTQRAPITAMYNGSWYVGSILSAWVTYATIKTLPGSVWAWRIPSILQAVPSLLQAILVWSVPESPRWLVAKGRDSEAVAVLVKYHADGRQRDPLVYFTYGQIREALSIEREISSTTSYLTLFKTPGNRRRMRIVLAIGFFSQWAGNGLVSYYIGDVFAGVGITDAPTVGLINGSLQIWNCFIAISAALLVDRLGRRLLFLSSNAGMLITFIGWTLATAFFSTRGDRHAANGENIPMGKVTRTHTHHPHRSCSRHHPTLLSGLQHCIQSYARCIHRRDPSVSYSRSWILHDEFDYLYRYHHEPVCKPHRHRETRLEIVYCILRFPGVPAGVCLHVPRRNQRKDAGRNCGNFRRSAAD